MVDRCVICGAVIPEGRQVCPDCESGRYCNTRGGCMICDRLFCGGVADGMDLVATGDPDDCVRHDAVSANLPDQ